ncbi:unnamed protein product [Protopolystoma xenopodis]|uniref:Uncharacterized protein n=1 Tax=Protopolystoma xenopodis TaxID=117903 RepID=A0A448WHL0_9PLAT|nr:unnamed protein product [Protopolystoma xenopodis]
MTYEQAKTREMCQSIGGHWTGGQIITGPVSIYRRGGSVTGTLPGRARRNLCIAAAFTGFVVLPRVSNIPFGLFTESIRGANELIMHAQMKKRLQHA